MVNKRDPIIVFDDSSKKKIFKALGLKEGPGSILQDEQNRTLTDQDFEPIKATEFGGVLKGSKIPIRKEREELVRYFVAKDD